MLLGHLSPTFLLSIAQAMTASPPIDPEGRPVVATFTRFMPKPGCDHKCLGRRKFRLRRCLLSFPPPRGSPGTISPLQLPGGCSHPLPSSAHHPHPGGKLACLEVPLVLGGLCSRGRAGLAGGYSLAGCSPRLSAPQAVSEGRGGSRGQQAQPGDGAEGGGCQACRPLRRGEIPAEG